jgi:hypothetical protein
VLKEKKKYSIVLYTDSTWSIKLNDGFQIQSGDQSLQQTVSKKQTLGMPFYTIATIVDVSDENVGHHNESWINHM